MTALPPYLVAGSALWDIIATSSRDMKPGYDVPGWIARRMGGVALNVALAIGRLGRPVGLLTAVGRDAEGDALLAEAATHGVDCAHVTRCGDPTDAYLAVESPDGEVFAAIADCASLERAGEVIFAPLDGAGYAGTLIVDGKPAAGVTRPAARQPGAGAGDLCLCARRAPARPSGCAAWCGMAAVRSMST